MLLRIFCCVLLEKRMLWAVGQAGMSLRHQLCFGFIPAALRQPLCEKMPLGPLWKPQLLAKKNTWNMFYTVWFPIKNCMSSLLKYVLLRLMLVSLYGTADETKPEAPKQGLPEWVLLPLRQLPSEHSLCPAQPLQPLGMCHLFNLKMPSLIPFWKLFFLC